MIRINKYLTLCNLGSRRKVENLVTDKRISIDGKTLTDLSYQVDTEKNVVRLDGKKISPKKHEVYLMLNKPKKYLVTANDDFNRRIVFDLLPDLDCHFFSIGRLDYQSEGLLLFTSDGDFANQIIHPRYKLPKLYKVLIKGMLSNSQLEKLRKGVVLNGKKTLPATVFIQSKKDDKTTIKITIYEGRKRQIRNMIKIVGSEVLELKRLQIGSVKLDDLPTGMWRTLKPNEIASLKNYTHKGKL